MKTVDEMMQLVEELVEQVKLGRWAEAQVAREKILTALTEPTFVHAVTADILGNKFDFMSHTKYEKTEFKMANGIPVAWINREAK